MCRCFGEDMDKVSESKALKKPTTNRKTKPLKEEEKTLADKQKTGTLKK